MRKFFVALLAVICISCAGVAVGCADEPAYYTLTYTSQSGVTYDFGELKSGYEVAEGYKVTFKVTFDDEIIGTPVVYANDTVLTPSEDGTYSFVMTADTLVKVLDAYLEPNYYYLTLTATPGVTYEAGGIHGEAKVKEGADVSFKLSLADNAEGEPKVYANGNEILVSADGTYTFTMEEDTVVTVEGVFVPASYEVLFDSCDFFVYYYDMDGNEITDSTETYDLGEEVSFKVKTSVYYGNSSYVVTANTAVLTPDSNGVFSFSLKGNTTISISGLVEEDGFTVRQNGGKGTHDDPFLIERPIDLYYMAALISDSFYNGRFALASYKLVADIDMEGEQLFIIGDSPSDESISMFCGEFDGNGHTISNYYINNIDETAGDPVTLPYVGLFGLAQATTYGNVVIKNLTLDNFVIEVNAGDLYTGGFYAGGIVGNGAGVEISNCKVNGTITVNGNTSVFGYVGGVAGYLMSVYSSDELYYDSFIEYAESNVDIRCTAGYVYAMGGVAGLLSSSREDINAYVINSYSTGEINGGNHSGGIVGVLASYSAVINSYTKGDVLARSRLTQQSGSDSLCYAYGGGIAGNADYDSTIVNCYVLGTVRATAVLGDAYAVSGNIVGQTVEDGKDYVQTKAPSVTNCYYGAEVALNAAFFEKLGWQSSVWNIKEGENPTLKADASHSPLKVTVRYLSGNTVKGKTSETYDINRYATISTLYKDEIPRYVNSDTAGYRSYGYYFDEAKTLPVNVSFIPTSDITLYADFADYNLVSGNYYIYNGENNAHISLSTDGVYTYRAGAVHYTTSYMFDGEKVVLAESPLFTTRLEVAPNVFVNFNICALATYSENTPELRFIDNVNYTEADALITLKENENFKYGEYYTSDNNVLIFNKNGTGSRDSSQFSYTVSDNGKVITAEYFTISGTEYYNVEDDGSITVGANVYLPYDIYKGVWENKANAYTQYEFDGKGNWTYIYYGYVDGEKTVNDSVKGTYKVTENGLDLDNGKTVTYDKANGTLIIGDETFYAENSFVGEWTFFHTREAVKLELGGITANGYGEAKAYYGINSTEVELNYNYLNGVLYLYRNSTRYGTLTFDSETQTLKGDIISLASGSMTENVTLCRSDIFKGEWISTELGIVEFNGLGIYDVAGTATTAKVSGNVRIGKVTVPYTVSSETHKATFVYNDTTYTVTYNFETNDIDVNESFKLVTPDDMRGLELVSDTGLHLSFNGGGNLAEGGIVTVVSGGETSSLNYKVSDGKIVLTDSENAESGEITLTGGNYVLKANDVNEILYIVNGFTGEWLQGGVNGGNVIIGKIKGDNSASGSYLGTEVIYTFDRANGYLSFVYDNKTLYVLELSAGSIKELAVSEQPNTNSSFDVCMKAERLDSVHGIYVSDNGTLELDGFSESKFGAGSAILKDNDGDVTAVYSYKINIIGEIELADGAKIFVSCDKDKDGAYEFNNKYFELVDADYFYLRTGYDADGNSYFFNGHGTLVKNETVVMTYIIEDYNDLLYEYYLTFVENESGEEYEVVYDRSAPEYRITTIVNKYAGSWVMNGNGGNVVIGHIGEDNTATGNYLGAEVTYKYHTLTTALTFEYGNKKFNLTDYLSFEYNGSKLYIFRLTDGNIAELAVTTQPNMNGEYNVCMKEYRLDSYRGVYTSANASLEFNGFSTSIICNGTVLQKDGGNVVNAYSYVINSFGDIEINGDMLFVRCSSDKEGAYVRGSDYYELVAADDLYLVTARDSEKNRYTFNGHGKLLKANESEEIQMTYVIESVNEDKTVYNLVITDSESGDIYDAVYDATATDYKITSIELRS